MSLGQKVAVFFKCAGHNIQRRCKGIRNSDPWQELGNGSKRKHSHRNTEPTRLEKTFRIIKSNHYFCKASVSFCFFIMPPPTLPFSVPFPHTQQFFPSPPRAATLLCPWQAECRMADVHSSRLLCQEQSSPTAAAERQLPLCFITRSQVRNSELNPLGRRAACFLCVWSFNCLFPPTFLSQILEQFNQQMRKSDQFLMSTH